MQKIELLYGGDAVVVHVKMSFYILWSSDLWQYAELPDIYIVTFINDVVYKNNCHHRRFFVMVVLAWCKS